MCGLRIYSLNIKNDEIHAIIFRDREARHTDNCHNLRTTNKNLSAHSEINKITIMKKVKIEIKTFTGTLLFKYESKDNTTKQTLEKAVERGADLRGAYLRGADLRGADLRGAYLTGADLRGADLRGADLTGADLRGAYLRGAYLRGADLRGADLRGAYLRGADLRGADLTGAYLRGADLNDIKIKKAAVFTGLYKYVVIPFISEKNEHYVTMGCYIRTIKEWDKDFWNNTSEFPNNKSENSQLRLLAYQTAKKWIKLMTKK